MKPLVTVLGLLVAVSALAGETNVMIKSDVAPNMCFDAEGDHKTDGDRVFMYKCHGRENQRWTVTTDENGQSAIVGTGGYCLDVRGAHAFKDGTPVQLWKCHFGANQRFEVRDGHIKEVASGKCLLATEEKDRSPIVIDECNHWKHEKWSLRH